MPRPRPCNNPTLPTLGVVRVLELSGGDLGYMVQEWLDHEASRDAVNAAE